MDREQLIPLVNSLRDQGKSIRVIARELGVHPSRVQRALNVLPQLTPLSALLTRPDLFVGREREVAQLQVMLRNAVSGKGSLVMVAGEPGIGKTRIVRELAVHAERLGARVLWGWCYEEGGAPPYWPWIQALRPYVQQTDPEQLRSQMGTGASDIAEVVGGVREKLPHLETPPDLEPEQGRFRLFDSITTFLKNAATSQPLLLVLDDLHSADVPSLMLLHFLTRQLTETRILVVGCYRNVEITRQHPLFNTLAQLSREPALHRLPLEGLSREDTHRFVESAAGASLPPGIVDIVYAHTEGNPFFMTEVVRLITERGSLTAERMGGIEGVMVPESVREAIGQRMNRRSEECNLVLTMASAIGREFSLSVLQRLLKELSENRLLEVLDEALAAGVIEELPDTRESYRFTHALMLHTLAQELSAARRARLHAQIGEVLEEMYGAGAEAHSAELAHHFGQALAVTDPERFARYSLTAGEQALAAYAWEDALTHFQEALAAKGEATVDATTAALLFGLGRAQAALANWPGATANLACAFDYYAGAGDLVKAASIAELPHLFNYIGQELATRIIGRALELVPPDSPATSRLLSRYCRALGQHKGDYSSATEAFERALRIARYHQDTNLETQILTYGASVDGFHLEWQRCLEKCLQALELSRSMDDPYIKQDAHGWAARALYATGELDQARTQSRAILSLSERLRDRYVLGTGLWLNEIGAHLAGDWRIARAFSDRCLALLPVDSRFLSTRALLEYQTGDFDEGSAYLERLKYSMSRLADGNVAQYLYSAMATPAVISLITDSDNHLEEMESTARGLLLKSSTVPLVKMWARLTLALLAMRRGDAESATTQYDYLRSRQSTMLVAGTIGISADRLLGLIAAMIGQTGSAFSHFENALAFCARAGYRPEYAWTVCEYAQTLMQNNAPVHHSRVDGLLNEASNIANTLGMRPLAEKVAALQEQMARSGQTGASRRASPAYPGGLSHREVEVLRLIVEGKSNQEIATTLVISLNTVVHHVTSILTKIGVANRTEAATYAIRHNLSPH